ncbi:hypothetical protein UM93_00150 [Psychromicrobium lacuslunae]|uniref:ATP-grasp domain-containing protein n=1 Tax=Psychromicrobium lacuslunae TaxID=1618207 RepID=A0A0D4C2A7_9MICC|nr:hypothetical protein UM93_00150 [Psychromicrobium lacuslunae]
MTGDTGRNPEHVLVLGTGRDAPARLRAFDGVRTSLMSQVEFVHKVRDPGLNSHLLALPADAPDQAWIAVAEAVHQHDPFTRIAAFGERDQDRCAAIGAALSLPTHSVQTIRLVQDKLAMRETLRAAGLDSTPAALAEQESDIRDFTAQHGFPCIVKPLGGSGSVGVSRVENAEQIQRAFAQAGGRSADIVRSGVIVESFLTGPQCSVEAFSEDGEHQILCITQKFSDPESFVELGHLAPAQLDEATEAAIQALVPAVLDALDIRFGPSHTEIAITADGPVIIETHTRVGGDEIPELVADITGADQLQLAVAQVIGDKVLPQLRRTLAAPGPVAASAIWFGVAAAQGELTALEGLEAARQLPGVTEVAALVSPGTKVERLASSRSRIVSARATAQDGASAVRQAQEAVAGIRANISMSAAPTELSGLL